MRGSRFTFLYELHVVYCHFSVVHSLNSVSWGLFLLVSTILLLNVVKIFYSCLKYLLYIYFKMLLFINHCSNIFSMLKQIIEFLFAFFAGFCFFLVFLKFEQFLKFFFYLVRSCFISSYCSLMSSSCSSSCHGNPKNWVHIANI